MQLTRPFSKKSIFFLLISLLIAGAVSTGVYFFKKTTLPTEKQIIFLAGRSFYALDPVTKKKREISQFKEDAEIVDAKISPDKKKLFYILGPIFRGQEILSPQTIFLIDNKGKRRTVSFKGEQFWTFSYTPDDNCFWSFDSQKLACLLIEFSGSRGAGTGRAKISLIDFASGKSTDIFISDQVQEPIPTSHPISLLGWTRGKPFFIRTTEDIVEIEPKEFYTVDPNNQSLELIFSYLVDNHVEVVSLPDRPEIFFASLARKEEDKFVKFNSQTGKAEVLLSSFVLGTTHPIVSEDKKKVIFTSFVFDLSPLEDPERKGRGHSEIHLYDLTSSLMETITTDKAFGAVESLLSNNKTFVISDSTHLYLFDRNTSVFETIYEGIPFFVGLGYF